MGGVHGVCYGTVGDNLPLPAKMVELYRSRNIHAMRIYSPDHEILAALHGSGIGLILDVGGVDAVHHHHGTPRRPGVLETYVFAMFNENQKPGDPREKNFGIFHPNEQPVYPINFPN